MPFGICILVAALAALPDGIFVLRGVTCTLEVGGCVTTGRCCATT
jgi:hypothetical protein